MDSVVHAKIIYRARASLGRPSKPSTAWRPTLPGPVFLCNALPSTRTLLSAVAGPRRELLGSYEIGPSTPPEPTLTVRWSAEFQSLSTGGSSGKGRLALVLSICADLLVFWSMTDWKELVTGGMKCMKSIKGGNYLHLGNVGVWGDNAAVLLSDLGFLLAEVLAGGVESSVRHLDIMEELKIDGVVWWMWSR